MNLPKRPSVGRRSSQQQMQSRQALRRQEAGEESRGQGRDDASSEPSWVVSVRRAADLLDHFEGDPRALDDPSPMGVGNMWCCCASNS